MTMIAAALMVSLTLGQVSEPPPFPKPTAADTCMSKCARSQMDCMEPCATAPGATDEKNKAKTMACVAKCIEKTKPCYSKCEGAKKRASGRR